MNINKLFLIIILSCGLTTSLKPGLFTTRAKQNQNMSQALWRGLTSKSAPQKPVPATKK